MFLGAPFALAACSMEPARRFPEGEIVGQSGLRFERDNVDQLAGHLDRLLSDVSLRKEYGLKARARALEFTWDRAWRQLRSLIDV